MTTLIKTIPKDQKRNWKVELNGEEIKDVSSLRISNNNCGELNYGLTQPGYDGWSFHEANGGGVVTVPFAKIEGRLYVGLIFQERHNQGGNVWNLPRGFMDPGKTHFESLIGELEEEIGFFSPDKRLKRLQGDEMNPNSAFFETAEAGDGVKYFSIEFTEDQLVSELRGRYQFKSGKIKPVSSVAEQIIACSFFPWRQATRMGDMFTPAGVGRLLASELIGF